ncbi:uncharacterized protein ARMOST_20140 [Armillaria ostoyae]|uniref:Uncharacterized protein n=1 Tax=Armillaria ostoyae TaxID=47428 RepID=A0A284S6J2_ARMOS|nr:uncharacterized protein ARMOST_20140 [Armillaria ostoyae]
MTLKEIHRTSTFTWSSSSSLPLIATGTIAGVLDGSFSNESQSEIWVLLDKNEFDLGIESQFGPKCPVIYRIRRVDVGVSTMDIILAGMENGKLRYEIQRPLLLVLAPFCGVPTTSGRSEPASQLSKPDRRDTRPTKHYGCKAVRMVVPFHGYLIPAPWDSNLRDKTRE